MLAECFLSTLQKYLKGVMADLRAYCITDVSASLERTRWVRGRVGREGGRAGSCEGACAWGDLQPATVP